MILINNLENKEMSFKDQLRNQVKNLKFKIKCIIKIKLMFK